MQSMDGSALSLSLSTGRSCPLLTGAQCPTITSVDVATSPCISIDFCRTVLMFCCWVQTRLPLPRWSGRRSGEQRPRESGRSGRRGRTEGREARSRPVWQTLRGVPRLPFPRKHAQRVLWGSDPWGVSADSRWLVLGLPHPGVHPLRGPLPVSVGGTHDLLPSRSTRYE